MSLHSLVKHFKISIWKPEHEEARGTESRMAVVLDPVYMLSPDSLGHTLI